MNSNDPYVQFMYARFKAEIDEKLKHEKQMMNHFKSQKSIIKKLSIVNALSFKTLLPKNIMAEVFSYIGEDNQRIARAIARSHVNGEKL